MGAESPKRVTTPTGAVFLSYASDDAAAAQRICDALRAAGVEVWFDKTELRGGDTWDASIRQQIKDCLLFIPIISSHTEGRREGYFRREWNLAAERTLDMAPGVALIVPVAIDDTDQKGAKVPDKFRTVQWTRLPEGIASGAFIAHIQCLVGTREVPGSGSSSQDAPAAASPARRTPRLAYVVASLVALATAGGGWYFLRSKAPAGGADFSPPPKSIAVLPFVNLSGDKSQDYFSDGITEELLNSLARINSLHVISRTSSFSFKGKDIDVGTIARRLNVGAILEGSVRRSGNMVRVTVQLIDTVTGFHLWSQTFDRELGDVLKLETEIASATANALNITLHENEWASIGLGGTRNAMALDVYLRGVGTDITTGDDLLRAASAYTEAIRLDPKFALAFAARSYVLSTYAANWATGSAIQEDLHKAELDARQAIALAPELATAHVALAQYFIAMLDLRHADAECVRARALEPNNVAYLFYCGQFAIWVGHTEAGLALTRQLAELDPLGDGSRIGWADGLLYARRYEEAMAAYKRESSVDADPDAPVRSAYRGYTYYHLGRFDEARKSCALESEDLDVLVCQATTYKKLGRDTEAQAALAKFMKLRGDSDPYAYAEIYAQWGDTAKAMEWLRRAASFRDTGLILLKIDPFMDPIRGEPEFKEILKSMNFPD